MTSAAPIRHEVPPSLRRAALPVALLGALVGIALAVQRLFDPFTQHIPLCAVHALTGLECPGCGATRAVHALIHGDLLLALQNNAPVILALPVLALLGARWTIRRVRGDMRPWRTPPRAAVLGVFALVMIYTVARNLPQFAVLAPTSQVVA